MVQSKSAQLDSNDVFSLIDVRLRTFESQLFNLLHSQIITFGNECRKALPESHGIYRILDLSNRSVTIRAGRTRTAARGLRQRVYQNHLMGDQVGNLRAQLVASGDCSDLEEAKRYIRDQFGVQILTVEDFDQRALLEHFMLALLQPRFSD